VPGDVRPAYAHASQARQILNDAEDDLREWRLEGLLGDDVKTAVAEETLPAVSTGGEKGKQKENLTPQDVQVVDTESVAVGDGGDGVSDRI
jgi:hypothetical protein